MIKIEELADITNFTYEEIQWLFKTDADEVMNEQALYLINHQRDCMERLFDRENKDIYYGLFDGGMTNE